MRILGWYVLLLAVALTTALLIQRAYLRQQVVSSTDLALDQEIGELRQLAGGIDPDTGEDFAGDLEAIFDTYFERNVPLAGEAVVTIIDGDAYKLGIIGTEFQGTALMEHWRELTLPERDQVDSELGPVRYLAIPMADGDQVGGVFVAAFLLQDELDRVDEITRVAGLVLGSIFLLASVVAWIAAGEVLRPLRLLDEMARSIGESDLSRRIPVEGEDEIANLARTFNEMLNRLEEAFATQRRFVDDAGHELRTPITVIRGQLEVLGDDPKERAETMRVVGGELDRMSRIVDDLLVLARAEQPDFIATHPIDLKELIEDLAFKAAALSGREVMVEAAEAGVIQGDRQRLTQAVMNLTQNAFEHGPPGVEVRIGGQIVGSMAGIWVADNGPGIPPEVTGRLFERFYRGRSARKPSRGAGLGLSIVRAIAEGHGGRVELDTHESGTTFTLVIPAEGREDVDR
jgi:signal transduction histidine kinase